jgi:diguanylate cyclase (GGDEF)-like protein/PAS domain S-box-containing protein
VAGILCYLTNLGTVVFLARARAMTKSASRWSWCAFAAVTGGFGIWATHFIAMLAYDAGVTVTYELDGTLLSLAIAIFATMVAGVAMIKLRGVEAAIAAGVVFGIGVSSMHFIGMSALEFGGEIHWQSHLVLAAIALSATASPFGFWKASGSTRADTLTGAALLAGGIVGMHFIAMGAAELIWGSTTLSDASHLSKPWMVTTILIAALSMILSGLIAVAVTARAERSTKKANDNFELLVKGVTDYAIYMLDRQGNVSSWNAGAERFKGYSASEIIGRHFSEFYSLEDRAAGLPAAALRQAKDEGRFEANGWRYRKDGTSFFANVVIQPVHGGAGNHIGFAKITRDISEQKAANDRIQEVSRNLDLALENMIQGICLFDQDERLVLFNQRYKEIFGFTDGFLKPGISYREIVERGYMVAIEDEAEAFRRAGEHYQRQMTTIRSGQESLIHKMSDDRTVLANFSTISDGGWVATFEDITDRTRSEEKVAFLAKHDALTKLPNRSAFTDFLDHEVAFAEHASGHMAVLGIDLNKFKLINDQLGHGVGDQVLVELGRRMSAVLGHGEIVARFGGDEFAALKRYGDVSELHDFVDRLSQALNSTVEINDHKLTCGASIGISLYPIDGKTPETLLANADLAMYRAKQSLTEVVCFYDGEMDDIARTRARMAKDLWDAIEARQFKLNYQVQKSVATGETTGYEVLLRWAHPERGNIPPADFIPVAEECGAILPIGEWVLREACREAAKWAPQLKVAVNLSPVQIAHADIGALVDKVLQETGLDPNRLELEITETSIIVDKNRAMVALQAIKALGVSIAIDDFGTGYSSLETLRSFPFDKIKLDRSFMAELDESEEAKAMVRAILALGQGLRIPVLAEGVETNEQLDILRSEGCHEAQGYLLGRPGPSVEKPIGLAA